MIGRKKEMQDLQDLYESGRAELVAVYGRRRVGKTYLIDEAFSSQYAFQHAGMSPLNQEKKGFMKKQLEHFYLSMLRYGSEERKKPKSWLEAFFQLEKLLESKDDGSRQVVFLDELPWMDTPRSGFLSAFEAFWNTWGCRRKNLMVIVCGSASSWMLDQLINNHGGLYNRVTYEINLMPFTLGECESFLEGRNVHLSRYDIAQAYMVFGGIPYYLGYLKKELSLAQNLDQILFSRGAKLRDEFERLFDSIFDHPDYMKKIIRFLSTKGTGYQRNVILRGLKLKEGETFSKAINALIASEFVIKYVPFGSKADDYHYKLTDPFCIFWLRFVDQYQVVEGGNWSQMLDTQSVVVWRGLAFENLCLLHVPQIKQALGISGVSTSSSAWIKHGNEQEKGAQVDLIISRRDHVANMCELKFYEGTYSLDKSEYETIMQRSSLLSQKVPSVTAVHPTLITTFGLVKNRYSGLFTNVILLDDLFA